MVSPGDRAIIKAEIERLQKAQRECTDSGIRAKIDAWIVEQKQKLAAGEYSPCPLCGKPCPPEECVTDVQGRTLHKQCYRAARISTHC
jgi:DNA repair exonuclease SbcCD ATPase subunit